MKFLFFTEFGEILDLAMHLKLIEGQEVVMHIEDSDHKKIGDGLIEKIDDWYSCVGQGYVWVFDGCKNGKLQDWLRGKGEAVFGGSAVADDLENNRQLGQKLFKAAGFKQPESHNFKTIAEATAFVASHSDRRWILKQNGDAPKSINHMGKFDGGIDMMDHLRGLSTRWNEAEYGKFDCDLMEIVDGIEVAASAFWNGQDWMRDKRGKVVGYLNFEEKKEIDGGLGETTGEMGTLFVGVDEDNPVFKSILLRPKIEAALKASGFRGVFDINGSMTKDGYVAFEVTCRFGIPATSYEFVEGLKMSTSVLLSAVAKGEKISVEISRDVGMVMVVAAKPYPVEGHLDHSHTSLGEHLWPLRNGTPAEKFDAEQFKHIHLYNFHLVSEGTEKKTYRVATDCGYLLTVTGRGGNPRDLRKKLQKYIKDNLYISGMKWRTDIGERAEDFLAKMQKKTGR